MNFPMVNYLMAKATELNAEHGRTSSLSSRRTFVYLTDEILEHAAKTGLSFYLSRRPSGAPQRQSASARKEQLRTRAVAGINRIRSELGRPRLRIDDYDAP